MKQVAGITTVIRCENAGFSPAQADVIATPSMTCVMQAKDRTQADYQRKKPCKKTFKSLTLSLGYKQNLFPVFLYNFMERCKTTAQNQHRNSQPYEHRRA